MPVFTPIQERVIQLLSDGKRHHREEIKLAIHDDKIADSTVRAVVFRLNKRLEPVGEKILCEYSGNRYSYRHVRLIGRQD